MAERAARFEYEVVVDFVSGGEIANLLKGYVTAHGKRIRFSGVAYARIGGQNVSPRLSPSAQKKARELFGDLKGFEEDLQLRLVNGEFEIRAKEGMKSPT